MILDLREIIGVPGGVVPFDYSPDLSEAVEGSVQEVLNTPRAAGNVTNRAGVLTFSATVDADLGCVCARCLAEYEYPVHRQFVAYLTEDGENPANPDGYFLQGDKIDIGEIISTEFVLGLDERFLCRPDCAGLCEMCGADLNKESCSCQVEVDPRLAALGQLLSDS